MAQNIDFSEKTQGLRNKSGAGRHYNVRAFNEKNSDADGIRQAVLGVTRPNSTGFERHNSFTEAPRQILSMTAPINPTEVIVCYA